ncbi:hypothetical protein ACLOJK_033174 [Asimina triloba]
MIVREYESEGTNANNKGIRRPFRCLTWAPSPLQSPRRCNTTMELVANPILMSDLDGDELHSLSNENEEQLLYRVLIFNLILAKVCTFAVATVVVADVGMHDSKPIISLHCANNNEMAAAADESPGALPSDVNLADSARDVDNILKNQNGNHMQGLGPRLLQTKEEEGERSRGRWSDEEENREGLQEFWVFPF